MLVQAFWRALNSVFGDKIQFKTTLKGASMLMNSAFRDLWVPGLCFVLLFATMIAGLIELFTGMLVPGTTPARLPCMCQCAHCRICCLADACQTTKAVVCVHPNCPELDCGRLCSQGLLSCHCIVCPALTSIMYYHCYKMTHSVQSSLPLLPLHTAVALILDHPSSVNHVCEHMLALFCILLCTVCCPATLPQWSHHHY